MWILVIFGEILQLLHCHKVTYQRLNITHRGISHVKIKCAERQTRSSIEDVILCEQETVRVAYSIIALHHCSMPRDILLDMLIIQSTNHKIIINGPLTRYLNCMLRMRLECRERFPRHRHQRKPLVIDPGMHHGTCVKHVPWCMSGMITRRGGEHVPGIPGACATQNFT